MHRCRLTVAVVFAGLVGAAPAAGQDTSPGFCAESYATAERLQGHLMSAAADKRGAPSLGGLTDNWLMTYVWAERAAAMRTKHDPVNQGLFADRSRAEQRGVELFLESGATGLLLMTSPEKVFQGQRQLFAELRACDLAHGHTPALGEPPPQETVLAVLKDREDRLNAHNLARLDALANLDDRQCAARFLVMGSVMAQDPAFQQAMSRKMQIATQRARAADPALTPERFQESVRREAQERSAKITSPADLDPLLEEVNACERKYGEPLTVKN